MDDPALAIAYKNAPRGVKTGRVLMIIGSILFFIAAIGDAVAFILALVDPGSMGVDWGDLSTAVEYGSYPALALFFLAAGIGGISFVLDKGKMKPFATLAAAVMLVVILVDTVLLIRHFIYGLAGGNTGQTWATLLIGILDVQLSGGIYVIGWFKCKDFVGD